MWRRRRDDGVEHVFTQEDREAQIRDLETACMRMADLLAEHGDVRAADLYRARAHHAGSLLAEGFNKLDLNELAGQFPEEPWWLNPKAADYNAPREPWQGKVARLHAAAREVAIDLRAAATTYRS